MKILTTLFLLIFSNSIYAWIDDKDANMEFTNEIKQILAHSSIKEEHLSPDKKSKVTLYRSDKALEEGEVADEVLNILTENDSLWFYSGYGQNFYDINFLDNDNLMLQERNFYMSASFIINLQNKGIVSLGGGSYEILDDKRIRLNHAKRYDELGAYWIDTIVNYQGDLIKVISKPESEHWKRKSIKEIVDGYYDISLLEQSLEEYIYVFR